MKNFACFVFSCALLAGCGMSSEDKANAGAALGSISSLASATARNLIASDLRAGRSCSPSTTTTGGITIAVTCPGSGAYAFHFTATGPVERTCGSTMVTVKDLDATITLTVTAREVEALRREMAGERATWTYTSDVTATVQDKALDCNFSMSFDLSSSSFTVSSSGYSCTYGGSDLDSDAITSASCMTR